MEPLRLDFISIKGKDNQDEPVILTESYHNMIILPPTDPEWKTNDPDNSNIHMNKGNCLYEFYVVYSNGDEYVLATFHKDNEASEQFFVTDYSSDYFYVDAGTPVHGMPANDQGYFLRTRETGENAGRLYFRDENRISGQEETEDFRIRISTPNGETIRPGDDMLLRFGVSGFPQYYPDDTELNAGDFMAVYDKKLLDRAKGYCNNDAGISDWTRFTDGATITDSVAYSWGCADSVEDFNLDLEEQRVALSAYYSDGENNNSYEVNTEQLGNNPDPTEHREWSPWEVTIAPGSGTDRWHNYLKGIYDEATKTYNYLTINGTRYNPYLPGLSSYKRNVLQNYHDYDAKRSAGTDCSGFIQKCAGYDKNQYLMPNISNRITWGGGSEDLIGPGGFAGDTYTWPVENKNLLVIGDIISCSEHVVLVWKIIYDGTSRNTIPENVYIIEAQALDWAVSNNRKWKFLEDYPEDFTNITIKRLKTE